MNIDSTAFAVDKYVGTLLQYKSLEELVQRGNAMVSEIKSLDSDMQMLVYENYNKFISATDTIRKMKNRVEVCCNFRLWLDCACGCSTHRIVRHLVGCARPSGYGVTDGRARE